MKTQTEHRKGWPRGKALVLYSGDTRFESRPGTPVILMGVFRGFPQSAQVNAGIVSRLGHDSFLTNIPNLSVIYHPTIRRRKSPRRKRRYLPIMYKDGPT